MLADVERIALLQARERKGRGSGMKGWETRNIRMIRSKYRASISESAYNLVYPLKGGNHQWVKQD
ncbi:hypothetical protein AV654_23060 [Paenibacillus elgii]|uniref:Uncharacterized protein n=1 Tax=Paenibacillus elgii TaxID=189691 RepID=A0A163WH43_9BACL|nr:hypothetical protein AV654_23060 [Paenibacillus elgii]